MPSRRKIEEIKDTSARRFDSWVFGDAITDTLPLSSTHKSPQFAGISSAWIKSSGQI